MSPGLIRYTVERARRAGLVSTLVTAAALPVPGQASDGRISFTGAVVQTGCAVEFNSGYSVNLGGCVTGSQAISAAAPVRVAVHVDAGPDIHSVSDGQIDPATGELELEFQSRDTGEAAAGSAVVVSLVYL